MTGVHVWMHYQKVAQLKEVVLWGHPFEGLSCPQLFLSGLFLLTPFLVAWSGHLFMSFHHDVPIVESAMERDFWNHKSKWTFPFESHFSRFSHSHEILNKAVSYSMNNSLRALTFPKYLLFCCDMLSVDTVTICITVDTIDSFLGVVIPFPLRRQNNLTSMI